MLLLLDDLKSIVGWLEIIVAIVGYIVGFWGKIAFVEVQQDVQPWYSIDWSCDDRTRASTKLIV